MTEHVRLLFELLEKETDTFQFLLIFREIAMEIHGFSLKDKSTEPLVHLATMLLKQEYKARGLPCFFS